MSYKFNSGDGAVICDQCKVIIDAGLSLKDYEDIYECDGNDGDFCWKCQTGYKEKDKKK